MQRRLFFVSLLSFVFLGSCNADKTAEETAPTSSTESSEPSNPASKVRLKTSKGDIVIALNADKAPISVANFLKYVEAGHYNNTVFHRVMADFMIQGGGFALDGGNLVEKKTGAGIKNESANGLSNDRGTIAMARTNDPNSATAQFFINVVDNEGLNYPRGGGYAVFGKVVEGMDVVDAIRKVQTGTKELKMENPMSGGLVSSNQPNVPVDTVVIKSATAE